MQPCPRRYLAILYQFSYAVYARTVYIFLIFTLVYFANGIHIFGFWRDFIWSGLFRNIVWAILAFNLIFYFLSFQNDILVPILLDHLCRWNGLFPFFSFFFFSWSYVKILKRTRTKTLFWVRPSFYILHSLYFSWSVSVTLNSPVF